MKKYSPVIPYHIKQGLKYVYGALPYSIRYGRAFRDTYNFLQESQWWSRDQLEAYQMRELSKLLRHAYENVPYYRKVFDERALRPNDIQDFNDLTKLPFLDRTIIRDNLPDLLARNYHQWKLKSITTGGTTGVPLKFYEEKRVAQARERAFILTLWKRAGYMANDKCVALKRDVFPSAGNDSYWRYDPLEKTLILSSFHITDKTVEQYLAKIRGFKPHFIKAFPSVITLFAKLMKENNCKPLSGTKAVLCGSENLYSWQRTLIEETFACKVYSWYGHSEKAVLGGECEKSTHYHIFPEYGVTELITTDNLVTKEDGTGEIVATGFNNYVMPLIRYKTGDITTYARGYCGCGRRYPLLSTIEGRIHDLILSKSRRLIPLSIVYYDIIEEDTSIKQFQFLQEKPGEVVLQIVRREDYSREFTNQIIRNMEKGLENDVTFSIRFIDDIPMTKSGKCKLLIQKLPIDSGYL